MIRRCDSLLSGALLLLAACSGSPGAPAFAVPDGFTQSPDKPTRVMIPMRDGKRMATDVYLPPGRGPWPVLLVRTPYGMPGPGLTVVDKRPGREGQNKLWDELRLYQNGYALAFQTARGRFDSEGEALAFGADGWGEMQDGYDTVEWIAGRPWCDGKVGTFGISGPGVTQYQMAGSGPPHLVCQFIGIACTDPFGQSVFQGGVYRQELAGGWIKGNGYDYPRHVKLFNAHPVYDAFWKSVNLNEPEPVARASAPALHWGGYWDIYGQAAIDGFVNLQHRGGDGARGRQRLIVGPWPHGVARRHADTELPENALLAPHFDKLEWFDRWMRGVDRGFEPEWPVIYYTVGAVGEPGAPGNRWRKAKDWPPVPAAATPLHLAADGSLVAAPPAEEAKREFTYDPAHPVPTLGGANLYLDKGLKDQRPAEGRPDVLVYTSAPLARPLEVTGRVTVTVWGATDAKDTDFTAKLTDVYPDGRSLLLLDGIRRLRFHESYERETFAEPGRPVALEIDLWTTSIVFNMGHRIRVAVSSSNSPRFRPNPNTGGPPIDDAPPVTAHNVVWSGPRHPSRIVLPVAGEGPAFEPR